MPRTRTRAAEAAPAEGPPPAPEMTPVRRVVMALSLGGQITTKPDGKKTVKAPGMPPLRVSRTVYEILAAFAYVRPDPTVEGAEILASAAMTDLVAGTLKSALPAAEPEAPAEAPAAEPVTFEEPLELLLPEDATTEGLTDDVLAD
jgi:hypothetical protein